MDGITVGRLEVERKEWRKNHPYAFVAKPEKNEDGSLNLFKWVCAIPGERNTIWENGLYRLIMEFKDNYPVTPPIFTFDPPIYHPNVSLEGKVYLSIIQENVAWRPSLSVRNCLVGIQHLLTDPNPKSAANPVAAYLFEHNRDEYDDRVRTQASSFAPGKVLEQMAL